MIDLNKNHLHHLSLLLNPGERWRKCAANIITDNVYMKN